MSRLGLFRLNPGFRGSSSSSEEETDSQRPPPNPNRVKRALFGPTDHEENLRFVRKEMKKAKQEARSKWNFDFENETPMTGGRFSWEESKASDMPSVYCERIPSLPPIPVGRGVEKENRVQGPSLTEPPTALDDPLSVIGSAEDLRTPQQGSLATSTTTNSSSSTTSSASAEPPPSQTELGARPKDPKNAKEKKLTDMLRIRKSRSKSQLRLKRLGGGEGSLATVSRSPSAKSRIAPSDNAKLATEKTEESGNISDLG